MALLLGFHMMAQEVRPRGLALQMISYICFPDNLQAPFVTVKHSQQLIPMSETLHGTEQIRPGLETKQINCI